MKLRYPAAVLAALVAAPAWAAEPESMSVQELSQLTGVKQSSLRVLMGARSTPGVYPLNYHIAQRDYREAMARIQDQGLALSVEGDQVRIYRIAGNTSETRVENVL